MVVVVVPMTRPLSRADNGHGLPSHRHIVSANNVFLLKSPYRSAIDVHATCNTTVLQIGYLAESEVTSEATYVSATTKPAILSEWADIPSLSRVTIVLHFPLQSSHEYLPSIHPSLSIPFTLSSRPATKLAPFWDRQWDALVHCTVSAP
jgi:hypothetical protein